MLITERIFWICLSIIFYSYIGYGIVLLVLTRIKQLFIMDASGIQVQNDMDCLPEVTLVIAAYNEENIIEEKIKNCFSLNYPKEKLFFLFITDGSSDKTNDVIGRYPEVKLLHQKERRGKTAALNRAMKHVHTSITIFCDANAMLNRSAVKRIVLQYRQPKTGGVSGEKRIIVKGNAAPAAVGEGLYWKYESILKRMDGELYTVAGAAGELFSIRTALWEPLSDETILDDFVISTRVNLKGYRIAYEPNAYASEFPSSSIAEERKRKIRISAGAFQAISLIAEIFNIFKYPVLFFQFFSHRFLRWTLTPLCLPILFIVNMVLFLYADNSFYAVMFISQVFFYLIALAGFYFEPKTYAFRIIKICHYFFFMNYSLYLGFIKFLRGRQSAVWDKAQREVMTATS